MRGYVLTRLTNAFELLVRDWGLFPVEEAAFLAETRLVVLFAEPDPSFDEVLELVI